MTAPNTDLTAAVAGLLEAVGMAAQQPAEKPDGRRLLTVTEAAEMLRVSRSFLYQKINEGTVASVKLGRRRLIPQTAIDALIDGGS